jgi:hypothetical protein
MLSCTLAGYRGMQVDRINRRQFMRLLDGATASASPVPAIAQQPGRTYRLGLRILSLRTLLLGVQSRGVVGRIYPEARLFGCPDLANVFVRS